MLAAASLGGWGEAPPSPGHPLWPKPLIGRLGGVCGFERKAGLGRVGDRNPAPEGQPWSGRAARPPACLGGRQVWVRRVVSRAHSWLPDLKSPTQCLVYLYFKACSKMGMSAVGGMLTGETLRKGLALWLYFLFF